MPIVLLSPKAISANTSISLSSQLCFEIPDAGWELVWIAVKLDCAKIYHPDAPTKEILS